MARTRATATTEEVTEVTESEVADANEVVNSNGEGEGPKRRMPTYTKDFSEVESFDELPEAPKFERKTRGDHYLRMLTEALTEVPVGKWFRVAKFQTPNGANQARKAITGYESRKGWVEPKTRIPENGDWEFKAQAALIDPDGPATSENRGSELLARHNS